MTNRAIQLRKIRKNRFHSGERGIALVSVLCLILSGSLIVTAILAMAQLTSFTIQPYTEMQRSFYVCEGAANRIQYLVSADRDIYGTNIDLASFDYSEYDVERFIPDGMPHTLNYYGTLISFEIHDAQATGLDLSSNAYQESLLALTSSVSDDTEFTDKVDAALDQIQDYTDSDETVTGDYGLEDADFDELGKHPLPANQAIQLREEFFYLPKVMALFPPDSDGRLSGIRLIPDGNQALSGNPNIFNASDLYLKGVFDLEDAEIQQIHDAIRDYRQEQIPLDESIESTLMLTLQRQNTLQWSVSNTYTVIIRPDTQEQKKTGKRFVFTWKPSTSAGPTDGFVQYLEWMFF